MKTHARGSRLALLVLGLAVLAPDHPVAAEEPAAPRVVEVMTAPELGPAAGWLNVERPLTWTDLRGKVVLLDFWTYGCINCLHVIADLKRLEAKHAPALVVIGVHSAKFRNEGESERIRQAVLRYDRQHPVVNDRDFRIWRTYGVRAWPTLVVVDADGDVIGAVEGEGRYAVLDRVIGVLIADARVRGVLDDIRLPAGYKLNPGSPFVYRVRAVEGAGVTIAEGDREKTLEAPSLPVRVPIRAAGAGEEARVTLSATFYYCRADNQGVCLVQAAIFEQPIRVAADAPGREVTIRYEAPGPPR